ncbi:YggT family protein [Candidatus Peregrinibacteria bacterium]|jgi:YggT family protein|nr:YggT family protein [Candidatus Peregrinibacteria bacterium]
MTEIRESILNFLLIGLEIYQFLILLYVLSSWFGGLPKNRFGDFIRELIAPIMKLAKKIPHHIGPIDLSPIYAFLIVGFAKFLVISLFS